MAVVGVLIVLTLLGAWRYDGFLGTYNVQTVLRYNSMFALGGAWHVLCHHDGWHRPLGGVGGCPFQCRRRPSQPLWPVSRPGRRALCRTFRRHPQWVIITRLKILPFIATLATMLAASGTALLLANNQSVSVSYDTYFTNLGQGDLLSFMRPEWVDADDAGILGGVLGFILSFPTPAFIALAAYIAGGIVINQTAFGRHVLAVGGGTEASRLMGLPVDRTIFIVYVISGATAGMAGVILASQFGAGQPIEGIGWELFAIASVVVGGTLLTGGKGQSAARWRAPCCWASSSPFSISRMAWGGFHFRHTGNPWCADCSCSSWWCCRRSCRGPPRLPRERTDSPACALCQRGVPVHMR